jgi:CRISPR-associated endoribonuclease Cas6
MLLSVTLVVTPTQPCTLQGFYGREVQAWFLNQVRLSNLALSEVLHMADGIKPYTVSTLIAPTPGRREQDEALTIVPGQECLLRLTSLSDPLSDLLLTKVIPGLHQARLHLRDIEFQVVRFSFESEWDRQTSCDDQMRGAGERPEPSVTLQLASPTAFRTGNMDLTLPTPDQVWRSLWWRWNNLAPENLQISSDWNTFVANCIIASDYSLRSMKVSFQKNGAKAAYTGCTGQITYRLLPAKHCWAYAPMRQGAEQVLHVLANFALFSGIGHHTTIGLGQARLCRDAQAESPRPDAA